MTIKPSHTICFQDQLDEAMKSRLTMITRQVREVKNVEDEVRQMRRQLDNFDRYFEILQMFKTYVFGKIIYIYIYIYVYIYLFIYLFICRYASTGNLVSTASVGIGSASSSVMGGPSLAGILSYEVLWE